VCLQSKFTENSRKRTGKVVVLQEVRGFKVAVNQQTIIHFSTEMGMLKHDLGTSFIISPVKRVEFISGRMSYITLRGRR